LDEDDSIHQHRETLTTIGLALIPITGTASPSAGHAGKVDQGFDKAQQRRKCLTPLIRKTKPTKKIAYKMATGCCQVLNAAAST
jgi:hypothetical protein